MSQQIFQPPVGLTWDVKKRPRFGTIKQDTVSARGQLRIAKQVYPIWEYEFAWDYLPGGEQTGLSSALNGYQCLLGLFGAMKGGYDTFLYQDPNDNSVTLMPFGTGDGVTTVFQLQRNVGSLLDIVQNIDSTQVVPSIYKFGAAGAKNLIANSEAISLWPSTGGLVMTPTAGFAPDGSGNATKVFYPGNADSFSAEQSTAAISNPGTYTFSVWLKVLSGSSTVKIGVQNNAGSTTYGSVACTVTATWQRFSITVTTTAAEAKCVIGGFGSLNGVPAGSFYAWGAQLEVGSSVTSYQLTNSNLWGPVLLTVTTDYTISTSGLVTFTAPPASGAILAWTGSFFYRLRFMEDMVEFNEMAYQYWDLKTLKLESVIL